MSVRYEPGTLYECAQPPVTEVIIGVAFEPVDGIDAAHFGAYWERVRKTFPVISVRTPILPPVSEPKIATIEGSEPLLVRADPSVRYWLIGPTDEELLQVQSDRFLRNWRKRPGQAGYPRFSELWGRFADSWVEYLAFLDEHQFRLPEVLQCELGYVNQIETDGRPLAWALPSLAGFSEISPHLTTVDRRSMVRIELPNGLGVAHAEVLVEKQGGWRFSLSAKGKPVAGVEGVRDWLLAVRGWLNHLFVSSLGDEYAGELGVRARV